MFKHYFISVCVKLFSPIETQNEQGKAISLIGYYKNFAVAASSVLAARSVVEMAIDDGEIDWNDSSDKEIDLQSFDRTITTHCKDPSKEGIWYESGRSLFPATEH